LLKKLQILPLQSQYIFSLLLFVIKNKNYFISNTDIYDINTHYIHNLYLPSANLSTVQKGVLFSVSKIYNHVPFVATITQLATPDGGLISGNVACQATRKCSTGTPRKGVC
jgi:hypothetical protein